MIGMIRYKIVGKYNLETLRDYGFQKHKYSCSDKCFWLRDVIVIDEENRTVHIPTRPYGVIRNYIGDLIKKGIVEEEEVK